MKIFIDGGAKIAVRRMFKIWEKTGNTITNKPKNTDVQLSSIRIKNKSGKPTVLRLDGIYYNQADNYQKRNKLIKIAHSKADAIIYQSFFSKKMCEKYLSKRKTNIFEVIYNGIDSKYWLNFKEHNEINIIGCGKWRRHKRLQETIDVFLIYLKYFPNAKLHILGKLHNNIKIKHPKINYYGMVDYKKMAEIYIYGDMFIHLSKKDSCPNSVVEAIGSGMPVITTNACGGSTEMCKLTKGCIICEGDIESIEPCFNYKDPYNKLPKKLKNNLINAMVKISHDRNRVTLPGELNIETTAKKYMDIMKRAIERKCQ